MSLASRVLALATGVGNYFRDSVQPRLVPPGGTTGQVLVKTTNTDYIMDWADQSGGGGGGMTKPQAAARSLGM